MSKKWEDNLDEPIGEANLKKLQAYLRRHYRLGDIYRFMLNYADLPIGGKELDFRAGPAERAARLLDLTRRDANAILDVVRDPSWMRSVRAEDAMERKLKERVAYFTQRNKQGL